VQHDDLVNCLYLSQILLKLVKIRFKNFIKYIVQVIFAELQHFVPSSISLGKHALNLALLCGLVDAPGFFQAGLHILLEE
jgi:hypothetical protein